MAPDGAEEPTRIELPDRAAMEEALAAADAGAAEPATDAGVAEPAPGGGTGTTGDRTRVLEFRLGDGLFCIDIRNLEEIVKRETVTRVPNTPAYVAGVVDLRGQITTILETKRLLSIEAAGPEALIAVFAPPAFEEYGAVGWIVDEVRQVVPVADEQVRDAPTDEPYLEGVIDREGLAELVVWVDPERAMAAALAAEDDA